MRDDAVRRRDIQGVRGIAVGVVALYHARVPGFGGGFVGVDVFFVISGYVIGASLLREIASAGVPSIGRFYARRFRRLFPAFAVCGLVTMVATVILTELGSGQIDAAKAGLAATFGVSNIHFLRSGSSYFGAGQDQNPFLHTWSLGVEEQFYAVVPVVVWLMTQAGSRTRWRPVPLVRGVMVLASVASFVVATAWVLAGLDERAFYHPLTRFWEMAIGVALASVVITRGALLWTMCGIVLLVAGTVRFNDSTPFPGIAALLPVGAAVALVIAAPNPMSRRLLEWRPLVWLGDRSYSFYLWHWPAIVIGAALLGDSLWVLGGACLLALLPAAASYRWVELPSQRWLESQAPARVARVAAPSYLLLATAFVVAVVGAQRTWGVEVEVAAPLPDWRVTEQGCFGAPFEPARCVFPVDEPRATIMLVGDSYAGSVSDGLIVASSAESLELIVFGTHACAHLPVRVDGIGLCRDRYQAMLALVREYRPDLVLAVHATTSYTRGRFGHRNGTLLDVDGQPFRDEAAATEHWTSAVAQAQADLAELGARLVIVDQTPAFQRAVVGGETLFSRKPDRDHLTRERLDELREPARLDVHEVLTDGSWIDTADVLCDEDGCDSRVRGVNRYFDQSHLSRAGSEQLAPLFRAELRRLLALNDAP